MNNRTTKNELFNDLRKEKVLNIRMTHMITRILCTF